MENSNWIEELECKYKCRKCNHEFKNKEPGPTQCPKCGHLYVDWLNWEEILKKIGEDV